MKNDCEFNRDFYLQIKGVVMVKCLPLHTPYIMAEWETSVLKKYEKKTLHYYRFPDDIWGMW